MRKDWFGISVTKLHVTRIGLVHGKVGRCQMMWQEAIAGLAAGAYPAP
jgi:hypothetical protein